MEGTEMHVQHFHQNKISGMTHLVRAPQPDDLWPVTQCGVQLRGGEHVHTNPETAVTCGACIYEQAREDQATGAALVDAAREVSEKETRIQQANNPKHAAGRAKQPFHQTPPIALKYLADAMAHGAAKYGAYNYSEAGVVASIYYDAMTRHKLAWFTGEWLDAESGIPHVALMMACCAILLECHEKGNLEDDRPKHTSPVCHTRPHPLAGDPIEELTFGPIDKPNKSSDLTARKS
jgi:hypothetical protein